LTKAVNAGRVEPARRGSGVLEATESLAICY
jgi:hypothetical protein